MGKTLEMAVKMKNFDNCKNVVFRINAMVNWGADLEGAVKECIEFAKATKCEVHMKFNCVDMWIRDYHTVKSQVDYYHKELDRIIEMEDKKKKQC